jgi:hypothetical protein
MDVGPSVLVRSLLFAGYLWLLWVLPIVEVEDRGVLRTLVTNPRSSLMRLVG